MAKPGQSSFRRLLLVRILLLSIPVLLTGEYIAYTKARSSFLQTARQNLTESAVRKGESIRDLVEATRSNLQIVSELLVNQMNQSEQTQEIATQITRWLPKGVQCLQLMNLSNGRLEASTCGKQPLIERKRLSWPSQNQVLLDPLANVLIFSDLPQSFMTSSGLRQLNSVFSVPVFDDRGQLRYALNAQVALHRQESSQPGSLSGYTVVIDQNGTILAHPRSDKIGFNISQEPDADRLKQLVKNAGSGKQDFLHLFSFEKQGAEWLAGYNPIEIQVSPNQQRTWLVLAVAPLNNALYGLSGIKEALLILTLGLVSANLLATLYVSRTLARPIENLSQYALKLYSQTAAEQAPKNFQVREINQLATALDSMVKRLEERAEELETAWQEAHEANELKSEFLATTSHELRTPLNAIIGCIRLVKDGCCDSEEEELEFLHQADEAAIHLLKIINDLLDIAKIEAGKVELNLQSVSIYDLCQQCLRMIQPGAEKKHLSLAAEVDPQLTQVPLDERRVRQMVINLLSNAVKFTPEGGSVKLSGRLGYGHELEQEMRPDHSPINPATPYLCLEVADTGIGIPKERWHLLFRPFQQVDSSLTRKHEGTGLGLSLTKRLAELHGGTISFSSTPNQGSTFRIWLLMGMVDQPLPERQESTVTG
mgnify:CR=1 FL=1